MQFASAVIVATSAIVAVNAAAVPASDSAGLQKRSADTLASPMVDGSDLNKRSFESNFDAPHLERRSYGFGGFGSNSFWPSWGTSNFWPSWRFNSWNSWNY
ncbi:hypothetical protein O5D80_004122 [Batrachochytrium dendrobatidis]|nr:hypothetical protein O5D80_004122 [Batrachochytrium dendrobatidis]